MNLHHFVALVRMRWQMARNRFCKQSGLGQAIAVAALCLAALASLGLFVFAAGWSNYMLRGVQPTSMMYVWDAIVAAFLFG